MLCNVALIGASGYGKTQKSLYSSLIGHCEVFECDWKVDDQFQVLRIVEDAASLEQLLCAGDSREEYFIRKVNMTGSCYPDLVGACNLATMDAAQFTQFNKPRRASSTGATQYRPTLSDCQLVARYETTSGKRPKILQTRYLSNQYW